ncbi:MAG: DMT family transporter [Anaerolineales bacterium]|nr:DMT family transporter [Anaerolineales bacterium]
MQQRMNLGVMVAALTGGVFGVVTTVEGYISRSVGAINASLIEHVFAAMIAVPAVIILVLRGNLTWDNTREILPISAVAGVLVIVAVAGVAYAMPRTGVAAGNMAMLFGQIAIAVIIDTIGVAGFDKVPFTLPRIGGLVLMVIGVYLVLPRQS